MIMEIIEDYGEGLSMIWIDAEPIQYLRCETQVFHTRFQIAFFSDGVLGQMHALIELHYNMFHKSVYVVLLVLCVFKYIHLQQTPGLAHSFSEHAKSKKTCSISHV